MTDRLGIYFTSKELDIVEDALGWRISEAPSYEMEEETTLVLDKVKEARKDWP